MCYPWYSYYVDENQFYTTNEGLVGHAEIEETLHFHRDAAGCPRVKYRGEYLWNERKVEFEDLRTSGHGYARHEDIPDVPDSVHNRIKFHHDRRFGDPEKFMDWLSKPLNGETVPLIIYDHLQRKDTVQQTAWEHIIPMSDGGSSIATTAILDTDFGPQALDILRAVNQSENKLEQVEWLGDLWNVFRPAWLDAEENRVKVWAK